MTKKEREKFLLENGWEKQHHNPFGYFFKKDAYIINEVGFITLGTMFVGHFDESYKYIEYGGN